MRIGNHEFEVSTERYQDGWRSYAFLPGGRQRASATCDSREAAEMDLYRQLKSEFAPAPKFDPTKDYGMSEAAKIVNTMLEAEGEPHDAHMKAYDRVQKWDKAHQSFGHLYGLKRKAMDLFREMGRSIGYERALAHVGLSRDDVERHIYGDQIGATHNFKGTRSTNVCTGEYCSARGKPQKGDKCAECGEVLTPKQVRYAPNDLRYKYPRHMFGVVTNDGRTVWFPQPIPPEPEAIENPSENEPS